jgi:hypothetical protein
MKTTFELLDETISNLMSGEETNITFYNSFDLEEEFENEKYTFQFILGEEFEDISNLFFSKLKEVRRDFKIEKVLS